VGILVDLDADRYGVAGEIMRLAEKTQVPVAVAPTAKAVIDETFPHYLGLYNGEASQPHVRKAIENSDCLLSVGYRPIDLTTGDFTGSRSHRRHQQRQQRGRHRLRAPRPAAPRQHADPPRHMI